jgi:hypothetical protein
MRRILPVIVLALVAGALMLAVLNRHGQRVDERRPASPLPEPVADQAPAAPAPTAAAPIGPEPHFLPQAPAGREGGGHFREARAYRLVLDGASCTLEAVEEIRGSFRKPRAMARAAGMLNCRLLDAAGRLLAEETMTSPDHLCVVLDPETPDADGRPTPAKLTRPGPATFQTRLPAFAGAATLEVVRLSGAPAASPGARPPGQLLASIPLAPR